jgi:hypothetical protein
MAIGTTQAVIDGTGAHAQCIAPWRPAVLLLSWTAGVVGCSNASPENGLVEGTITINGKRPASGAIAFTPVDGLAPTSGGMIADGKYSVEVALGKSKVAIRVPKVVGERKLYDTRESPVQPVMEESLPAKFNDRTVLTIDVQAGTTAGDFDLQTKQ